MSGWLNRTVVGAGLTSFLADVGYELATALIPSFVALVGVPGASAAAVVGAIEAAAEFVSNAAKLLVGWWTDRVGRRKPLVVFGYALTGSAFALCAVAAGWPLVLLAKCLGWLGKGVRGPLRNAILADAVDPADRGKAFGFHRAGDTLGAVAGPLLAAGVLALAAGGPDPAGGYRIAFWLTLVPGLAAAGVFALLVREKRFTPKPGLRLGASVAALPAGYRRYLFGVGLFGLGDFSHALLIMAATVSLAGETGGGNAAVVGILLYAWRNLCQAACALPAGWLGDRVGHRPVLVGGYLLGAANMGGFALLVAAAPDSLAGWAALFAAAGAYNAVQETLEPAVVPELVPDPAVRGTAFGVLAVVNGLGDVFASLAVGGLVTAFGWAAGLGYAAAVMAAGAGALAAGRRLHTGRPPEGGST